MRQMSVIDRLFGGREPRSTALAARQAPAPLGLWALLPVNALALVAAMALVSSPQPPEVSSLTMLGFATLNAALGAAIAYRLRGYELPSNRRAHVRIMVQLEATLSGAPCEVYDLSLGGASVAVAAAANDFSGEQILEVPLYGEVLRFRAEPIHVQQRRGVTDVGLRYAAGQDEMISRLAVALLKESTVESTASAPVAEPELADRAA